MSLRTNVLFGQNSQSTPPSSFYDYKSSQHTALPSSQFMPRSCNDLILTHISLTVHGKCTNNLFICLQLRRGGKHGVCGCVCLRRQGWVQPPPHPRQRCHSHAPSRPWKPTFNECSSLRSGCRRPPPPLQQKGA